MARFLGVLSGEAIEVGETILYDGWNWLRAEQPGWWEPAHPTGAVVKSGELLGTMKDLWGDHLCDITAPQDGTVLFQTSSPAVIANGILVGLALH